MNEGENKFTVKGTLKRPDLLIYSKRNAEYYAMEIKNGDQSRELHDASKIIEYWEQYEKKESKYYVDEKEVKISSFCIGTLYSMWGKLFKDDKALTKPEGEWKETNDKYRIEPLNEFARTKDYTRSLWSQWRKKRKKESRCGVGVLLSNALNREEYIFQIGHPLIFNIQKENNKWKPKQKEV